MKPLVLIAALLATPAIADEFTGEVVGITDGDTISVMRDGAAVKVRLEAIDAPEKGQPFSNASKQMLSDFIYRRGVHVLVTDTDRYGPAHRACAPPATWTSPGEMLRMGMAWH